MTRRLRFWSSGGIGMGVIVSFVLMLLSGVAFPLHIAGAGTMLVSTGQVTATGFALTPGLDLDSASNDTVAAGDGSLPAMILDLASAPLLTHLVIQKRFDFSPVVPGLGLWRLVISTGSPGATSATALHIEAPHLCANTSSFGNFYANARRAGPNSDGIAGPAYDDLKDDLDLTIGSVTLGDNTAGAVNIEAGLLSAGSLSVSSVDIRMTQGDYVASCLNL